MNDDSENLHLVDLIYYLQLLEIFTMRIFLIIVFISCTFSHAQENTKISTVDFVQVLNGNMEEVLYYYKNNWQVLREMAVNKNYIEAFQLLETPSSEEAPFQIILITTYLNEEQYKMRESHFDALIKERGPLRLMNEKQPGEFRKILFSKENVQHKE